MSSELFFENKKYISTKKAAAISGYSNDYVGQLCRGNKIDAKRVGRAWYVSEESILNHKKTFTLEASRSDEISFLKAVESDSSNEMGLEEGETTDLNFAVIKPVKTELFLGKIVPKKVVFLAALILFIFGRAFFGNITLLNAAQTITSVPRDVYQAIDDVTSFYGEVLGRKYIDLGEKIIKGSSLVKREAIEIFNNPALYVVNSTNHFSKREVVFVEKSSTKAVELVSKTQDTVFAFVSDSTEGVSQKTSFTKINSLTASAISSLNPVDRAGVAVYREVSSWFKRKEVSAPTSNFFSTIQLVAPSVVTVKESAPTPTVATKVVNTTNVVERTVVKVSPSDITKTEVDLKLEQLNNKMMSEFSKLSTGGNTVINNIYQQIAQSQRIDNLNGTTITNPTITGGSITNTSVSASSLSVTGTATSTFAGGLNITNGCLALNGVCLGLGGGSGTPGGANTQIQFNLGGTFAGSANFVWDNTNARLGIGTTTPYAPLAVSGEIVSDSFFATSTTATSTIAGGLEITKGLNLNGGYVFGAGLTSCSGLNDKLIWNSVTGQFSCGVDVGAGSGITTLGSGYSSTTATAVTFSTTTTTFNGLTVGQTITSTAGSLTFTPTISGTLTVLGGGTGISSPSAAGVLLGNYAGNGYMQVATSSLGLLTTNVAEGTGLYYLDSRARASISSSATGLTYTSGTGVFSLTAGYNIPLTSSTTDWNIAYLNRIT
ncbi:MAG: trimeric autotransporter adhesin, partial [Patescibacteria group bacterium]|nr:trimeric autotransporter adhesin [Patescibacteria group bacterium]